MTRQILGAAVGLLVVATAARAHAAERITCSVTVAGNPLAPSIRTGSARPLDETGPTTVFEVEDFSFDVEQTLNIGSQSSGGAAGPLHVTQAAESFTPSLLHLAATGAVFSEAVCSISTDASTVPYLTLTLTNAVVTRFGMSGAGNGPHKPRAEFWFSFDSFSWR
jgi:type VI protein secretion system component Hcp